MNEPIVKVITDNYAEKLEIKRYETQWAIVQSKRQETPKTTVLNDREATEARDFISKYL